jgi:large subunit ribosomal protein L13
MKSVKTVKTYSQKASEISRKWTLVDASTTSLGRVATVIATRLTGKYKPTYTPHMDDGDYVVVINASQIKSTGDKEQDKVYYRHSGFPGGIKSQTLITKLQRDPESVIAAAVKGMLPRNKLAAERLKRLRVFSGETHTHEAQKPVKVEVK